MTGKSTSHQVGILMASRIFSYVAMVLVPIVNTRMLGVEQYGYYRQFHLLFATLSPMLILGFPLSLQYYLPRADTQREKSVYVTQTLAFLTLGGLVCFGIYSVLGQVLGGGMGEMIRAFYWRICAFSALMIISDYMELLFAAESQFGRQAVYHVTYTSVQAVVVMTISWVCRDVSAMIWGLTFFSFVRFGFVMAYTFKRYRPSFSMLSLATIREQLTYALPIGVFAISILLLNQTDKFIINRFMGREAFAIYFVGAFQLPFVNMINSSVRSVIFPLMVRCQKSGDFTAVGQIYRRAIVKMAFLYFPMFVYFESTADGFIGALFTGKYADATPIFMIYLLLLPQVSTNAVSLIQVFKKTQYLLRIYTAAIAANLLLSLLLFKFIGRIGVPLGTVITLHIVNIVDILFASRLCETKIARFFPFGQLLSRFVVAAMTGIPLWWYCQNFAHDNVWSLGVLGIGYLGIYFLACRAIGLITFAEVRSFFGGQEG